MAAGKDKSKKKIKRNVPIPPDVRILGMRRGTWVDLFEKMEVGDCIPLGEDEIKTACASANGFKNRKRNAGVGFEFSLGRGKDQDGKDLGTMLWRTA